MVTEPILWFGNNSVSDKNQSTFGPFYPCPFCAWSFQFERRITYWCWQQKQQQPFFLQCFCKNSTLMNTSQKASAQCQFSRQIKQWFQRKNIPPPPFCLPLSQHSPRHTKLWLSPQQLSLLESCLQNMHFVCETTCPEIQMFECWFGNCTKNLLRHTASLQN